jgi:hypothetical protein
MLDYGYGGYGLISEAALRRSTVVSTVLSYFSRSGSSAKFFTRLYALDKGGSRRRRMVRYSTGSGAPIGVSDSTAPMRPFALTASQACEPG